jgi:hypothetical protein
MTYTLGPHATGQPIRDKTPDKAGDDPRKTVEGHATGV